MSEVTEAAPEATYENPANGETFTASDAEAAGWRLVHDAVSPETEGVTLNSTVFRAEKYVSPPGRPGVFIDVAAHTEEGLLAAIQQREQQFSVGDEGTVLVPKEADAEVDTSDESTFDRVSDGEIAAARVNDVLTVLSDPEDPDSDPVQKVMRGGVEVDESVLSEPATPNSATEQEVADANQAALDEATDIRDDADSPEEADGPGAAAQVAEARHDALQDAHDNAERTQPEAGEATDASDSEQQSQVPDSEAATSDQAATGSTDEFPQGYRSQPEEAGPDTDAEAPAPAPNAGQGDTGTGRPTAEFGNAGDGEAPKTDVTPTDENA